MFGDLTPAKRLTYEQGFGGIGGAITPEDMTNAAYQAAGQPIPYPPQWQQDLAQQLAQQASAPPPPAPAPPSSTIPPTQVNAPTPQSVPVNPQVQAPAGEPSQMDVSRWLSDFVTSVNPSMNYSLEADMAPFEQYMEPYTNPTVPNVPSPMAQGYTPGASNPVPSQQGISDMVAAALRQQGYGSYGWSPLFGGR